MAQKKKNNSKKSNNSNKDTQNKPKNVQKTPKIIEKTVILDEYLSKIIKNIKDTYAENDKISFFFKSQPKINLRFIEGKNDKNDEKTTGFIIDSIIFGLDLGEKSDLLYIKKENIRYSPCKIDIKDWNFPKDEIIFENENVFDYFGLDNELQKREGQDREEDCQEEKNEDPGEENILDTD